MSYRSTDELSELARFLMQDLLNQGMKQVRIAEECGVSVSTLHMLRHGAKVDVLVLQSLLDLAGCELYMRKKE